MNSDTLRALAREQGRHDIDEWIAAEEAAASARAKAEAQAPLETPAGVLEFGKRYDVTVRRRGGINPPSERRLRNVTVGPQRYSSRGLNYEGGRTAVGWYDLHTIVSFEEVK